MEVTSDSNTVYQGISDFSKLAAGTFVQMDGAVQADGSLRATRVEVEDPSAVDVLSGPVMAVWPAQPVIAAPAAVVFGQQQQGKDRAPITGYYDLQSAVFQISGQLNNLQTLPFVPSFSVLNMVAGQNVYVSSPTFEISGGGYAPANTLTLMPQTINGTVMASAKSGNFTDYTVLLASYDLFPTLAVQQGQKTLLNNPSQVEVYVDSNTQMLNTQALASGSTLRFYGLVFNDNGTLRMDCAQVNDGVAFSPQSASISRAEIGQSRTIRRKGPGGLQQTTTVITRSRQDQP